MTESQLRSRAEFIREAPVFCFYIIYAVCFFGGSAAMDFLPRLQGRRASLGWRYLFPISLAFPFWCGLRSWSSHVLKPPEGTVDD